MGDGSDPTSFNARIRRVGYDISVAYVCVIPTKGKVVVQIGLVVSFPSGVYARIALCLRLAIKKLIDVGARVINNACRGEIGVILLNHSAEGFQV